MWDLVAEKWPNLTLASVGEETKVSREGALP